MKEVEMMKKVNHRNVVKYYSCFRTKKFLYIVMEYWDRGDLSKLLATRGTKNYFSNKEILDFAKQIFCGMLALHSKGIVHRDIKNKNIFVTNKGEIKIGDFSEARSLGLTKWTKANFCFGTPQTTSPEIVSKSKYDHKADLWSVGVVLYQLTNLELPFKEESIPKLYKAILK